MLCPVCVCMCMFEYICVCVCMCMFEHMCVYIYTTRNKTVTNEIETKLKVNLELKHSWAMSLNLIIFV